MHDKDKNASNPPGQSYNRSLTQNSPSSTNATTWAQHLAARAAAAMILTKTRKTDRLNRRQNLSRREFCKENIGRKPIRFYRNPKLGNQPAVAPYNESFERVVRRYDETDDLKEISTGDRDVFFEVVSDHDFSGDEISHSLAVAKPKILEKYATLMCGKGAKCHLMTFKPLQGGKVHAQFSRNQLKFMAYTHLITHQPNTVAIRLAGDTYDIYRSLERNFGTCFTDDEAAMIVNVSKDMQTHVSASIHHYVFSDMDNGKAFRLKPLKLYENVTIARVMIPADKIDAVAPLAGYELTSGKYPNTILDSTDILDEGLCANGVEYLSIFLLMAMNHEKAPSDFFESEDLHDARFEICADFV